MIQGAPALAAAYALMATFVIWLIQRWAFGTVITHKDGKIAHLEERLKMRDDQLTNKLQSTPPGEAQELIRTLQTQIDAMKPRRLTDTQKASIARTAIARGGGSYSLTIIRDMASADSGAYANDLIHAFGNLQGWTISSGAAIGPGRTAPCGLGLCVHNRSNLNPGERIIFDILQSAEIDFEMIELVHPDADVGLMISAKL